MEEKPKEAPNSVEAVYNKIFAKTYVWIGKKPPGVKILFGVVFVFMFTSLARIGLLGEPMHRVGKKLMPFMSLFDEEKYIVPLNMTLHAGERRIRDGDAVKSGEQMVLEAKLGAKAWLSIFCVDSKGIQPIFREKLNPSPVKGTYSLEFLLDQTLGNEIYFAVASSEEFDFEKTVKPALLKLFPSGSSKGPIVKVNTLDLPGDLVSQHIQFNHIP